jgi:hypothetical protein
LISSVARLQHLNLNSSLSFETVLIDLGGASNYECGQLYPYAPVAVPACGVSPAAAAMAETHKQVCRSTVQSPRSD